MTRENPPSETVNQENTAWYEPWFGTRYYHLLYRNRNSQEAEEFILNLIGFIGLPSGSKTLDLPCGKGRHAIALHACGMDVTAADLSEENILTCKSLETERMHFVRHDMRSPLAIGYFDAVFNLFTSFGYFDRETENQRVVDAAAASLRKGGVFILDFLNVHKALHHLVAKEKLKIEGVDFHISRRIENGKIVKQIVVSDGGTEHHYREEVRVLSRTDLETFLTKAGFTIEAVVGDYSLAPFEESNSPRIIFISRKA